MKKHLELYTDFYINYLNNLVLKYPPHKIEILHVQKISSVFYTLYQLLL